MDFIEALQELANGKKIRKRCWNKEQYLTINKDGLFDDGLNFLTPAISIDSLCDIKSDEWELYKSEEEILIKKGKLFSIAKYCENNSCVGCILREEDECDCECIVRGSYQRLETMLLHDTFLLDDWSDDKTDRLYKLIQEKK